MYREWGSAGGAEAPYRVDPHNDSSRTSLIKMANGHLGSSSVPSRKRALHHLD